MFGGYALLGDDIVIHNELVAQKYQEIMESLGVVISEEKTIISKDTIDFAKRIFINKSEVSPISINGILETSQF
jgi:hypothetical protein